MLLIGPLPVMLDKWWNTKHDNITGTLDLVIYPEYIIYKHMCACFNIMISNVYGHIFPPPPSLPPSFSPSLPPSLPPLFLNSQIKLIITTITRAQLLLVTSWPLPYNTSSSSSTACWILRCNQYTHYNTDWKVTHTVVCKTHNQRRMLSQRK